MGLSPLSRRSPSSAHRSRQARALREGSTGRDVQRLQSRLGAHGQAGATTRSGVFCPKTKAATQAFQDRSIQTLDRRIQNAPFAPGAAHLVDQRNALALERGQGVAGPATQRALDASPTGARAPGAAPINTTAASAASAPAAAPTPTPALPPPAAATAVGTAPSVGTAPMQPSAAPVQAPPVTRGLQNPTHTVKSGDTMSGIARDNGMSLQDLIAANPQVSDPNRINVGQKLNLAPAPAAPAPAPAEAAPAPAPAEAAPAPVEAAPAPAEAAPTAPSTYTVKSGDTMGGIARDHNVTLGQLVAANPQVSDPNRIGVGQQLNIPDGASAPAAPADVAPTTGTGGGPIGQAALAAAQGEIGVRETGNNGGVPSERYMNGRKEPWCANFVAWSFEQAGTPLPGNRRSLASVQYMEDQMKGAGKFIPSGQQTPQPGDVIFFKNRGTNAGTGRHVGIVERVENGRVYTVEGNSSDAVRRRDYDLNNARISGYGRMD